MGIKNSSKDTISANIIDQDTLSYTDITVESWIRNPSWLTLPSMTSSDSKFIGLIAVFPEPSGGENSNFLALNISGNFTVDWGDGVTENFNAGTAYHVYSYNDTDLANTNAPVTLTDSGDKIERTSHGYINGMEVKFFNIVSTTGISEGQRYYVINANANDFQISTVLNGSAVTLTNNGSATLLNYKQAIVVVTPQAGQNLTTINLDVLHNQSLLPNPQATPWLDIKLGSPNLSTLYFYNNAPSSNFTRHMFIEQVEIVNLGIKTSCSYLFYILYNLRKVIIGTTQALTDTSLMFYNCRKLESINLFNTSSVTDMNNMFVSCFSLSGIEIPNFNTSSVTNMSNMFNNCSSLITIPLFNTKNVTNMSGMFQNCTRIKTIPLLDTRNVTNMSSMFSGCYNLLYIPSLNTSKVTDTSAMFNTCYNLEEPKLFDTSSVTTMTNMFNNCFNLKKVPLFNTKNVTLMNSMFNNCYKLKQVPLFDTAKVTNMSNMFSSCFSLVKVPLFNTSNVTLMNVMFANCSNLKEVPLFNTATNTGMSNMFNSCTKLEYIPLFNTQSVTNMTNIVANCVHLKEFPPFNTSSTTTMGAMFTSCNLLNIPALNFSAATTLSFGIPFTSAINIDAYGARVTHTIGFRLSKTALKKYMDNLGTVSVAGNTLTITNNWGVGSSYTKTVTSTAQSTTVTCSDTSNLAVGMMMTGPGTGITTGISVTSDISLNTLALNNHGLINGTKVSFSALGTTTGVNTNTIYYIVNTTANDFQISLTQGGSAIDLTGTNSTMTLKYPNYISSINTNVSIVLDLPAASSQTNASWVLRGLDAYGALLRGWAITF